MIAQRLTHISKVSLLALALMLTPFALGAESATDELNAIVPFKVVLEEVGGGSDSAVSADGKWIAFSARRSGNLDIWIVSTETGETRQITHNPAVDNEPRWRPDGKQITFVTLRNKSQDVYVIDLETGKETPIATEPYNEDYPSYSKDGSEICYTGGPRGFREVKVYDFKTAKHRTLTKGYGYVGATNFAPGGKEVLFHAYYDGSYASGRSDVYIVPAQGGKVRNVTKTPDIWDYKPNWSFDGEWITFSSKRTTPNFNIWVSRPDGSDLHAVTDYKGVIPYTSTGRVSMANSNRTDVRWPNWTRDGRLCWHVVNAQTGRLRALEVASGKITDLKTSDFNIRDLSLSPDGAHLAFENDGTLYVTEAPLGSEPKGLGRGLAPRWTSDGKSLTFLKTRRTKVGIVPIDGGEAQTINIKPGVWPEADASGWSPDGKTLALVTETDGESALTLVTKDGSTRAVAKTLARMNSPVWSKDGKFIYYTENRPASVSYCLTSEPVVEVTK